MRFRAFLEDWVIENGSYKLVALFITLILWVSVLGRKEATLKKEVSLNFNPGVERIVTTVGAKSVVFDVTASRRTLRRFSREMVKPITVDLSGIPLGRSVVPIPEDTVKLPFGTKVLSVNPATVVVEIDELQRKTVPVRIIWKNEKDLLKLGLSRLRPQPEVITIEGAATLLKGIREVQTVELDPEKFLNSDSDQWRAELRDFKLEGIRPLSIKDVILEKQ